MTNQTDADFVVNNPDGSATLQCRLDSSAPGDWATCPTPLHFAASGEGYHTLEVRSIDNAGNAERLGSVPLDGGHDGSGRADIRQRARQPDDEHVGELHVLLGRGDLVRLHP